MEGGNSTDSREGLATGRKEGNNVVHIQEIVVGLWPNETVRCLDKRYATGKRKETNNESLEGKKAKEGGGGGDSPTPKKRTTSMRQRKFRVLGHHHTDERSLCKGEG